MTETTYRKIDAANKIAGIATPILIGVIGIVLTLQKNASDEEKATLDRVTATIQHLSSHEPRERMIGLAIVGYLIDTRKLPPDLRKVLLSVATNDDNRDVAVTASKTAYQAARADPSVQKEVAAALELQPARVYFHIQDERQRVRAQQLADVVGTSDVKVPGIQRVLDGPGQSELRFFRKADQDQAGVLASRMKEAGWPVKVSDLSAAFADNKAMRPRHFEFWAGKQLPESGK